MMMESKRPSVWGVGKDIIMQSPTIVGVVATHQKLQTGLKIFGFGLVGLLAIRQLSK
jgi:hypothetical protein